MRLYLSWGSPLFSVPTRHYDHWVPCSTCMIKLGKFIQSQAKAIYVAISVYIIYVYPRVCIFDYNPINDLLIYMHLISN